MSSKAINHSTCEIFPLRAIDPGELGEVQSREPHCENCDAQKTSKVPANAAFASWRYVLALC